VATTASHGYIPVGEGGPQILASTATLVSLSSTPFTVPPDFFPLPLKLRRNKLETAETEKHEIRNFQLLQNGIYINAELAILS
jgi:hypothetical protein